MKSIKIVSDGTTGGTRVYSADGVDISDGITNISLSLAPAGMWRATVEFIRPVVEITARVTDAQIRGYQPHAQLGEPNPPPKAP